MISTTEWVVTIVGLALFISLDLIAAIVRRNKKTTIGEAAFWTFIYVGTAIIFGALLPHWGDKVMQKEYFAGWLTEYALWEGRPRDPVRLTRGRWATASCARLGPLITTSSSSCCSHTTKVLPSSLISRGSSPTLSETIECSASSSCRRAGVHAAFR